MASMRTQLKNALAVANLTQRELGRRIGLREESLSRFIHHTREISDSKKTRIAQELGMKREDLFEESTDGK